MQNIEADELFSHGQQNQQARLVQQHRQEEILLLLRDIAQQMSQRQLPERHRSAAVENAEAANQAAVSRLSSGR